MPPSQGFELIRAQEIPEIASRAGIYRHRRTGAQLVSLENDDRNKVFGISFYTPPPDSSGLPHILEHSVLCGSRRYPVKDPFIQLARGSLNTFLNAMTYPDRTVYPLASQNLQDFYNLIDVYLDAVFHPRLTPDVLAQEGWRHEAASAAGPLSLQGVVYNEMKGAMSSPERQLARVCGQALFPETPYRHDAGGDPHHIPDLTWEAFRAYHRRYYHPGNARIWFSGDDDPRERLRLIDDFILELEGRPAEAPVPLQPRRDAPRSFRHVYAAGEENGKAMLAVNWLLGEGANAELTLGLGVLDFILLGTPASPLRRALIESGLGEDLTGGGLDHSLRQMTFASGLKGIAVGDDATVERLILDTLGALAEDGIEAEMIEAALNTVEFRLRENNTGGFPRGLSLMLRSLNSWLYGHDPLAPLAFEAPLAAIRGRITRGERWFEQLIRQWLLENPHRATVLLEPDTSLNERLAEEERARLAETQAGMDEAQMQALVAESARLKAAQERPDAPAALATIPLLKLADLEREGRVIPLERGRLHDVALFTHDIATSGIAYLDIGFNLRALPRELLPWVGLFSDALLEMGTRHEDYARLAQRIGRQTGGIHATSFVSPRLGSEDCAAWLVLRAKGTLVQAPAMLAILRDVLLDGRLDDAERFTQLALEEKASAESGLIPAGHAVVNGRLSAHFSEAAWLEEQLGGIDNLFFTRALLAGDGAGRAGAIFADIRRRLVNRRAMFANLTLDGRGQEVFLPQLGKFLEALPAAAPQPQRWARESLPAREGLGVPSQVNFVGKGARLEDHGHAWHGSALAIRGWLNTAYLWEKLRVQGGAYGAFAVHDRISGVFNFLSYRDPHLLRSLEVYDDAAATLARLNPGRDELTRAIIGAIGALDRYQLPDAQGYTSLLRQLSGLDDETRQATREELLGATAADFRRFAEGLATVRDHGDIVVLGATAALKAAGQSREDLPGVITELL